MYVKCAQLDIAKEQKKFEAMDLFIKILSGPGIKVEYDNVQTAYFTPSTNTITLPIYVISDPDIFIRLGTHEAAHALWTPRDFYNEHNSINKEDSVTILGDIKINRTLFSCINIVEDIRIEKLIRQNFPGIIGAYKRSAEKFAAMPSWNILNDIKDNQSQFSKLTIADKINLKSKFKDFLVNVDLTNKEYAVLKYLSTAKTFDDVLIRAYYLYKLINKDIEKENLNEILNNIKGEINSEKDKQSESNLEIDDTSEIDYLDKKDILDYKLEDFDRINNSNLLAESDSGISNNNLDGDSISDLLETLSELTKDDANKKLETENNDNNSFNDFNKRRPNKTNAAINILKSKKYKHYFSEI